MKKYYPGLRTSLEAPESSEPGDVLVKAVGHEELNSFSPMSSPPLLKLSDTGSAAPSPFILGETSCSMIRTDLPSHDIQSHIQDKPYK